MSFVVLTDTSGNLPTREAAAHDLKVIPFTYTINGQDYTCTDTEAFDGDAFYERIRRGVTVTTTQICPQNYVEFFEPYLRAGKDVLFVCMSSGISGSCNSAHIAADMLAGDYPDRRIEIIDTRGASLGEGIIALKAARLRDIGRDVLEAAKELRGNVERMFNVFTVDDLMHLKRGGRLSNLSAIVGTVLQIKPLLKGNEEGKIVAFAKLRGRRKSIQALAQLYDRLAVDPQEQVVGIAQAGCREDAQYLAELISLHRPPREILTVEYEPVTGSHVGPGALALFFEAADGVRSFGNEGVTGGMKEALAVGEAALRGTWKTGECVVKNTLRKGGEAAASLGERLREYRERDQK
ncbi:MAG: DegV family protein [Oscillospiraceae bacterium]|nr:DegV family protein [Oscillospiraceae bacterium]